MAGTLSLIPLPGSTLYWLLLSHTALLLVSILFVLLVQKFLKLNSATTRYQLWLLTLIAGVAHVFVFCALQLLPVGFLPRLDLLDGVESRMEAYRSLQLEEPETRAAEPAVEAGSGGALPEGGPP